MRIYCEHQLPASVYIMSEPVAIYDNQAPKKSVNLSINSDLLNKARELNINLSQIFEQQLAEFIRRRERERWVEENREAIEAYNKQIEEEGAFGDDLRSF